MSQTVTDLVVVFILWMTVSTIIGVFQGWADNPKLNTGLGCLLALLVTPITTVLGGTVVYMLWNIVMPYFGIPRIDLILGIAINWLAAVLIRGFGVDNVRVTNWPKE